MPLSKVPCPVQGAGLGLYARAGRMLFYLLSCLLSHSVCISASSSFPAISGSTYKGWSCLMRGKASVNAFMSLCIHFVQWMEEVISVSQRLLAWCSHHKKGFSAGTGWKMILCYLNDNFGGFCWGAVTVLEQQHPSQASWWWGLCYKTCRRVVTSSIMVFQ